MGCLGSLALEELIAALVVSLKNLWTETVWVVCRRKTPFNGRLAKE